MKFRLPALLVCLPLLSAIAADPLLEQPPLKLTVSVGGKEIALKSGEEKKVEGEFKDPVIKVTAAPTRTFVYGGITFDYPALWNWSAEKTDSGYGWTMGSLDVTVLVHTHDVPVNSKVLANEVAKTQADGTTVEAWSGKHGGRQFKGWRVSTTGEEENVNFYVFSIPVKEGSATLQVLDNFDKGEPSKAFRDTMEMLGKTLKSGGE